MDNQHDISVLNGLIATTFDSLKGFDDAAEHADSTRYAAIFAKFAQERTQVAQALQAQVRVLGGDPEDGATLLGAAHRGFMDLKQALLGRNDQAIIEEVERGEDHIKAKFEYALDDTELQSGTRDAVREAFLSVQAGHDQASALKHGRE
ncbi:ferritin-like domain-containing protein [Novosphingobium sp. SG720]|uniref:ferritin-like domain-containing protein n=1 Tax=Novosphingobium TaxID=165696 RepID=UPI0014477C9B|nr:PA2169 family four-helix-bundle protein [Novosphingobium sp. SG720]NKJ42167.1 uncharacterized protein (TIGR02284 family) [Novosphingobium sp. SG720]